MEKEFIPYEQAVELEQLGFDERCFGFYYDEGNRVEPHYPCDGLNRAPLYQQAFRWFREKYDLVCIMTFDDDVKGKWFGNLYGHYETHGKYDFGYTELFKTPEEAELECLKKLIEIVKNNEK